MVISAKKPSTTEGIAEKSSITGFIISLNLFGANSAVKIAEPKERGKATIIAIIVTFIVPIIKGRKEYLGSRPIGCQSRVRKNVLRFTALLYYIYYKLYSFYPSGKNTEET